MVNAIVNIRVLDNTDTTKFLLKKIVIQIKLFNELILIRSACSDLFK